MRACRRVGVEAISIAVEGARRLARLLGTFGWRAAEEDDRADQLIEDLLRPVEQKLELLPVVGRLDPLAFGSGHDALQERGGGASLPGSPEIWQLYVAQALARFDR